MDSLATYIRNDGVYRCPSERGGYRYAYNRNLSGKNVEKIANPAATRAIFESGSLMRSASDPVKSLPDPPRHSGGDMFCYADGHAKWVSRGGTPAPPSPGP